MWDSTVAWLAEIARVTTFDYRDTGLSSAGTQPFSEIDDVAAVLADAGIDSAALVGNSEGGRRALAFAHQYPQRVSRAVVVNGSFGAFPEPSTAEAAAWQEMLDKFTESITYWSRQVCAPQPRWISMRGGPRSTRTTGAK